MDTRNSAPNSADAPESRSTYSPFETTFSTYRDVPQTPPGPAAAFSQRSGHRRRRHTGCSGILVDGGLFGSRTRTRRRRHRQASLVPDGENAIFRVVLTDTALDTSLDRLVVTDGFEPGSSSRFSNLPPVRRSAAPPRTLSYRRRRRDDGNARYRRIRAEVGLSRRPLLGRVTRRPLRVRSTAGALARK